jgi:hypothetical protein
MATKDTLRFSCAVVAFLIHTSFLFFPSQHNRLDHDRFFQDRRFDKLRYETLFSVHFPAFLDVLIPNTTSLPYPFIEFKFHCGVEQDTR